MAGQSQFGIFISYARKDGARIAQRLQSDLANEGFDTWLDLQRIAGASVWSADIDREIDSRQVTLALLSPGSYVSEICRAEHLRALDKGNRVIPVLAVKGADRPTYLYARQYRDFTCDAAYASHFPELLADIRSDATATLPENYRTTRVTYLTAPPRVANYLDRPEALRSLRDALFAEDNRQPLAMTAIDGMGGVGKTVLAKALVEDPIVQRAFPDGIAWITAGKERKRDFVHEMRELAKALGDDLSQYDNPLACENQYRTTIASKAALIVMDDVWSKADIEPLLAESPRSRFLFTTRDASIGRFVGAREHHAGLLNPMQSRALLANWASLPAEELPTAADEIVAECGCLPLALSVVGAMLREMEPEFWIDTLALLRRADLSAIQEQLPPGQNSFFKAVETSFISLSSEMQQRYVALAVLPEDMAAPLPILASLWAVSQAEARRFGKHLADRSLAQRAEDTGSLQLHDLQLDYVRAQFPDRESLALIRGAVQLSAHIIEQDPLQFASQMVGRLLPHQALPFIQEFTNRLAAARREPWLRPMLPTLDPPGTGLLRTLSGHLGSVKGVAVAADGRRCISAAWDGTIKVWDMENGRLLRTIQETPDNLDCVAITPDGRRIVSGDRALQVWDLESGQELLNLAGHAHAILCVVITSDGRRAVTGSHDATLKVWDLENGRELLTLEGHRGSIRDVAVTPDGRYVVSAGDDTALAVWDLASGHALSVLQINHGMFHCVAVSPDGRRVIAAAAGNCLKVWDLESSRVVLEFPQDTENTCKVAITPDGQRILAGSRGGTIRVLDMESGRLLRTFIGHAGSVDALAISADGRRAVSGSYDKTVKIWDLENRREPQIILGHSGIVECVAITPDARRAVSGASDGTIKTWDVASGRELCTLWEPQTLKRQRPPIIKGVAITSDGRRAVSGDWCGDIRIWDLESHREPYTVEGRVSCLYDVVLTGDGRRAIAADSQGLRVWDLWSGQELAELGGAQSGGIRCVAIAENGRRAISGSNAVKIWDLKTGREVHIFEGHSEDVTSVAITPDGRRAVSCSLDRTVKIWDLEARIELGTIQAHSDWVQSVAISRDGSLAISASADKTLKVWDLRSRGCLTTFTFDGAAKSCALADDRTVVVGDQGGRVHFLALEFPHAT